MRWMTLAIPLFLKVDSLMGVGMKLHLKTGNEMSGSNYIRQQRNKRSEIILELFGVKGPRTEL